MVCTLIVQTGDVSGLESQFWKGTVSLWQGTGYQNQLHRAEFLKKVTVSRYVEKLLAHCGNRRFITVFTKPRHFLDLPSGPFPSCFPPYTYMYIYISPLPNTFHGPCPARPAPSDHPNSIWWRYASWIFSLCSSARSAVTGPASGPDVFKALFGVFWCAVWKYY